VILAIKEPSGLDRQDGKHPDTIQIIPWHDGRPLIWVMTVVSPLAASYTDKAATNAGTVANMAASRRLEMLRNTHHFLPHICLSVLLRKILARSARQR